jgi:predicted cupin superfamily sugar epimerase
MATALSPSFTSSPNTQESLHIQDLIKNLELEPHIEGGFFKETDRAPDTVPSPFPFENSLTSDLAPKRPGFDPKVRNSSTTIFTFLRQTGHKVVSTEIRRGPYTPYIKGVVAMF